eukprot:1183615-Prorocentrum_minimum.AAC.2
MLALDVARAWFTCRTTCLPGSISVPQGVDSIQPQGVDSIENLLATGCGLISGLISVPPGVHSNREPPAHPGRGTPREASPPDD